MFQVRQKTVTYTMGSKSYNIKLVASDRKQLCLILFSAFKLKNDRFNDLKLAKRINKVSIKMSSG